ncbi:MAG: HD domain-containing protein [Bacilli bacterium]|nr:HD domain-containing protein [Bacilli bacterium]
MKTYIRNIYFSRSFHRLAGKTQLYSNYDNDHFHNRLTHTLEVADIANEIWDRVCQHKHSSDIVEAIALCHDLGHTPFGHAGERALNDITYQKDLLGDTIVPSLTDKIIFKHNYYSAKVALGINHDKTKLDKVLAGIILHTNLDYGSNCCLTKKQKENTISFYLKNFDRRTKTIKLVHKNAIEAQIVALADEISQRLSDMHDILLTKDFIINYDEISKILPQSYIEKIDGYPETFKIKKIIELLGSFYIDGVSYCNACNTLKMNIDQQNSMDYIKGLVSTKIRNSQIIKTFDIRSDKIVKSIFKKLYKNPRWIDQKMLTSIFNRIMSTCKSWENTIDIYQIFPEFRDDNKICSDKEKIRFLKGVYKLVHSNKAKHFIGKDNIFVKEINSEYVYSIVFYIANMTDRFALEKYRQINSLYKYLKLLLTRSPSGDNIST